MVYPTDIPTLGTPGPNLSAAGGSGLNKEHDDLHLEEKSNLEGVMNMLGLPANNDTATVLGRLNNLETYPQVKMLGAGDNYFLLKDVGGYLIVPQQATGGAKVTLPTGDTYKMVSGTTAQYGSAFTISGRELTPATQSPYPLLIVKDPALGATFWWVSVLNWPPDATPAAPVVNESSRSFPGSEGVTIAHNFGSEVQVHARGQVDTSGGVRLMTVPIAVETPNDDSIVLRSSGFPAHALARNGVAYDIVINPIT